MSAYQSYRNLPPLAGICSLKDAMKPGLAIEQCVTRLKRYHYAFKRLHQIFTSRLTAEPIYELKMAFSLHAHLCAEHVTALRKRVGEMREPPLGLEAVPDASLGIFFDEILGAPTTEELVLGIYEKAVPALDAALKHHLDDTNPLADQPSARLCKFALVELAEMQKFGEQAVVSLVDKAARKNATPWLTLLDDCLAAAGQLDGAHPLTSNLGPQSNTPTPHPTLSPLRGEGESRGNSGAAKSLQRMHSAKPYQYDKVPRRDERFPDPYNMGVNAEVFLYDEHFPPEPKTLMMFYKRLREIDVPEMMASIIVETPGQAVGLLPRHDTATLGRGASRDDGRSGVREPGHRLGEAGDDQLHVVAGAEHAIEADRAACGVVFY
jgi:hypothetical protein